MDRVENYLDLNNEYLKEAQALMEKGDWVQASEKFWGAAAEMVKAVAAKRGIETKSHGELYEFVAKLRDELNEPELIRLFTAAASLHQNFCDLCS